MRPVPPRFVLAWAAIGALVAFVPLLWEHIGRLVNINLRGPALFVAFIAYLALLILGVPFLEAGLQGYVLGAFHRPVPGWTLKVGAAYAVLVLPTSMAPFVMAGSGVPFPWSALLPPVAVSFMASMGTALAVACAVWGRRWPPHWLVWFSGRLLIGLLCSGLWLLLQVWLLPEGTLQAAALLRLLHGALVAAGTAWLLWRFVLSHPRPSESTA